MSAENQERKDAYLAKTEQLVNETQYGSITLLIQDGKVIQIDKTEKYRLKN